ncbi:hypothetical protein ACFXKR_40730 [Streptomyces violascens]|uniref:hypothetical protein n=1 Tax=Streptomyces violascens TaxID=67381 RepID=UPI0036B883AB
MLNDDDEQTTFLLYAPERTPHAWGLDLAHLGDTLRGSFHDVSYEVRQDDVHGGAPYLWFWAVDRHGTGFDGTALVQGRDCIMLSSTTAGEAAGFVTWLRDSYLPAPDLIRYTSEDAIVEGIESDWKLPAASGEDDVAEELRHHLHVVSGA